MTEERYLQGFVSEWTLKFKNGDTLKLDMIRGETISYSCDGW